MRFVYLFQRSILTQTGCRREEEMAEKKSSNRFEFTIVAGTLKGKKITAPDLGVTRPPLTRLRKSIFDFLTPHLEDAAYLDLFSGTGSYLFEAISRGASSALGIELEPRLVESINKQAEKFGVRQQLTCRREDVYKAVERLHNESRQFDIIMMAPPQYREMIDRTLRVLRDFPVSTAGGMILCQHDTSETGKIDFLDFSIHQRRKYGNTTFTVLKID